MTDPAVVAQSSTETPDQTSLTKSQKKRLRQKRKKARNHAAGDDTASMTSSDASLVQQQQEQVAMDAAFVHGDEYASILTPAERQALLEEGFSQTTIVQAFEAMWDRNLAYDEYEAVLRFLRNGDGDEEEEEEEMVVDENKEDLGDQGTVQTFSSYGEGESQSAGDTSSADLSAPSPKEQPKAKLSMVEKLDVVANAENVTDSIFALTQWISRVASSHEVRSEYDDGIVCS